MDTDKVLRNQLVTMMKQGNAFTPLTETLNAVSYDVTGKTVNNFPHTIWELTEHIRLALHDLVEYSKDSHYQSPPWPEGYWPDNRGPYSEDEWKKSVEHIQDLLQEMINRVQDTSNDLFEPFAANPEHNLLRQATIVAEHCAYHAGQIAMLRKAMEE